MDFNNNYKQGLENMMGIKALEYNNVQAPALKE